jgi:modulator of FtsH protease
MLPLADWQTFFAVQAGAAATLTGLVFVSMSINLSRIMEIPGLPGRAVESLAQLLQVFFISSVALVPRQPVPILAGESLAIGVASWLLQFLAQLRYARSRKGHPLSWLLSRVFFGLISTGPICAGAALLALGNPTALFWIVGGFVFSFIASVMGAWILLVEILR